MSSRPTRQDLQQGTIAWPARDDPVGGVHGVEFRFHVKGPEGAVAFVLYTGWLLPETLGLVPTNRARPDPLSFMVEYPRSLHAARTTQLHPMPVDLGYHSRVPIHEGQLSQPDCYLLDGQPCFYDGSALNASRPFEVLLRGGTESLFTYLEHFYVSTFEAGDGDDS